MGWRLEGSGRSWGMWITIYCMKEDLFSIVNKQIHNNNKMNKNTKLAVLLCIQSSLLSTLWTSSVFLLYFKDVNRLISIYIIKTNVTIEQSRKWKLYKNSLEYTQINAITLQLGFHEHPLGDLSIVSTTDTVYNKGLPAHGQHPTSEDLVHLLPIWDHSEDQGTKGIQPKVDCNQGV